MCNAEIQTSEFSNGMQNIDNKNGGIDVKFHNLIHGANEKR